MKRYAWIIIFLLAASLFAEGQPNAPSPANTVGGITGTPGTNAKTTAVVEEAKKNDEPQNPLLRWFSMGGGFMYVIAFFSIIGMGVIIERSLIYQREGIADFAKEGERAMEILRAKDEEHAIEFLEKKNKNIYRILANGLRLRHKGVDRIEKTIEAQARIEVALLEKRLNILSAVGTIAPLLGFLGTVAGMIDAFDAIAKTNSPGARVVASGISEALITTEFGLILAIPVFFTANFFYHRVDTFASEMEKLAEDIVNFRLTEEDRRSLAITRDTVFTPRAETEALLADSPTHVTPPSSSNATNEDTKEENAEASS